MWGIKLFGLTIGFLGLVTALLNQLGCFENKGRVQFAELIRTSNNGIPSKKPGFKEFMARFPPPKGVADNSVTHIVKDVVQTHDKFPISTTIRYIANGQRTKPVASYGEVREWARKTKYGWYSWVIMAAGWSTVFAVELFQWLRCNQS